MAQEQGILKGQEQFDQIAAFIRQSSQKGRALHEVEADLWKRLLNVGQVMLEAFVAGVGTGNLGPTLEQEGRP